MGKLVCTVELDKVAGVTVTVKDANAKITQTVKMNGTTIELKVVSDAATSTYTQDAESVTIACKRFELKAEETVTVSSGKATSMKSQTTYALESQQAMSLKSMDTVAVTGTTAVKLTGANVNELGLDSSGAKLAGAPALALEGKASAQMSSPATTVKADGMLEVSSGGVATFKGALTNLQGNLVNLG